jgi:hypothetical protein
MRVMGYVAYLASPTGKLSILTPLVEARGAYFREFGSRKRRVI